MKKRIKILIGMTTLGLTFYLGSLTNKVESVKITPASSSLIAMYIQDEDGNYNLSDAREFPKDGYVLNTEKSSCKNGGVISQNASTKALSLKVKTSDECTVYFDVVTSKNPSADILIAKANDASATLYASGNKQEMFVFYHDELTTTVTENSGTSYTLSATQVMDWNSEERKDYRYIGNKPNNYITFNEEVWRIIGVFTVETESGEKEQLIKIIRNQHLNSYFQWDKSSWINEWSTSSLQKELNSDYYNQAGSYINTSTDKGLNLIARSQVTKVKWYLGGSSASQNLSGPDYYNFERGIETCVTTGSCSGQTRTTSIIQSVGLMYPSDYIYTYANGVDNTCYINGNNCSNGTVGWLFNNTDQWTISPYNRSREMVFHIARNYLEENPVDYSAYARPTLYLNSSVKITGGDGSQGNPYTIE